MSDREKIQSVLNDAMTGAGGMLAVRALYNILGTWMQQQGEQVTIDSAISEAALIAQSAEDVGAKPELWTNGGRFDEDSFNHHFGGGSLLSPEVREVNLVLGSTIRKLDQAFQWDFSVESAQHFLQQVAEMANLFQQEAMK